MHIGQTLGKIGSTGRSTGPHLHYETRIHGEAVDPQKFLRAGLRLGGAILGGQWLEPMLHRSVAIAPKRAF